MVICVTFDTMIIIIELLFIHFAVNVYKTTKKGEICPRTVLTWAENYIIFNDIEYAFKLSFLNRCDEIERPIIEEYFQRSFGIDISDAKVANVKE